MTAAPPGDQARVAIRVDVAPAVAFRVFTEEIDAWWRRGLAYRVAPGPRGIIHLEPRVGGRLFESFDADDGPRVVETGTVTAWEPPARLVLEWRAVNFVPAMALLNPGRQTRVGPVPVTRFQARISPRPRSSVPDVSLIAAT